MAHASALCVFCVWPQPWLTDDDVEDVMAQYDTNKDGVIK